MLSSFLLYASLGSKDHCNISINWMWCLKKRIQQQIHLLYSIRFVYMYVSWSSSFGSSFLTFSFEVFSHFIDKVVDHVFSTVLLLIRFFIFCWWTSQLKSLFFCLSFLPLSRIKQFYLVVMAGKDTCYQQHLYSYYFLLIVIIGWFFFV